jgi:hypothetical protein
MVPMKALRSLLLPALFAVSLAGCDSADRTDSGGVYLSFGSTAEPIPVELSEAQLATDGVFAIPEIVIQSNLSRPGDVTTPQMDVQLSSYEVVFTRADGGTRIPPPLVNRITFTVPAGGNLTLGNIRVMQTDQILTTPLSDLLIVNGGLDRETGRDTIILNYAMRFFGRTVSGKEIETPIYRFTIRITR